MSTTHAPTCEQISDGGSEFHCVLTEADPSWRHGCRMAEVFMRQTDGTFWQVTYRKSTDGETNELREGLAKITQVEPRTVKVVKYFPIEGAQK